MYINMNVKQEEDIDKGVLHLIEEEKCQENTERW